jgi:fibronectin-binding autotransporter adhesin
MLPVSIPLRCFAAALLLSSSLNAQAAARWTNASGDGHWANPVNWSDADPNFSYQEVVLGEVAESTGLIDRAYSLAALTFTADAPAYTLALSNGATVYIGGEVINRSALQQSFWVAGSNSRLTFSGALNGTIAITNTNGGTNRFLSGSSAGHATIINDNGYVDFTGDANAGHATIGGTAGIVYFTDNASAANATIEGALTAQFTDNASAGNATLRVNMAYFDGNSSGGSARLIIDQNGIYSSFADVASQVGGITFGSLEGSGGYLAMGGNSVTVGSLNTTTTWGGFLYGDRDANFTKVGSGTLIFTDDFGASYGGQLTITGGTLQFGDGGTKGSANSITKVVNHGTLAFNRSNNLTFAKVIEGTGSVVKEGAGTHTLNAINTYSGGTFINNGFIAFTHPNRFGSGEITLNGGGLSWGTNTTTDLSDRFSAIESGGAIFDTGTNSVTFNTALTGVGGITKTGSGTLTLAAVNTFSGPVTVSQGTLTVGATGSFGSPASTINVAGGTLNLAARTHLTGAVMLNGGTITNGTLNANTINAQSGTFSAALAGSGAFTKTGTGTITLSTANTNYSGQITVSDGILRATTNSSVLGTGQLTLEAGVLQLASTSALTFGNNVAVTGNATITSDRTASGAGLTFTLGTLSIGTNTLNVTRGTLATSGTGGIVFGATTLTGNATFNTDTNTRVTLASVTGSDRNFTMDGSGSLTVSGALSLGGGDLIKSGSGTLTLNGATTYGATIMNGGTLTLGANASIGSGDITINGGSLAYTKSAGLAARQLNVNSGGVFNFNAAGAAGTGTITVDGGTLQWANGTTLDLSSRLALTGNATFDTGTNTISLSSVLTSNYGLIKAGSGTLSLATDSSFAGNIVVTAGTLKATSNLLASATGLTLGGGTLSLIANTSASFNQAVTLNGNTTFTIDRATSGAAPTLSFDTLSTGAYTFIVTKTANATGTAQLSFGETTITDATIFSPGSGVRLSLGKVTAGTNSVRMNGAGELNVDGRITGTGSQGVTVNSGSVTLSATDSSFTGSTTVNVGVLSVTKLADLGQASSLGAPTTATRGQILLGFGSSGTLRYIGDTHSSTNRNLQLAGNNGIGSILDSSGIGTVAFTGTISTLSTTGTRSLTLTGSNSGHNYLGGALNNPTSSGTNALIKSGAGTWVLGGTSNYSGGTSLNGGVLSISANENLGAAAGTVSFAGGTLLATETLNAARATTLGSGGGTFGVTVEKTLAWEGKTTGTARLTKTGAGTLLLSGANTYSGGTTVNQGSLIAGSATAFGTGAVTLNAGTLDLANQAVANTLNVHGGAVTGLANYTGTQTLSVSLNYSGQVGGSLIVTNTGALDTTGAIFTGATTIQAGAHLSGSGTLSSLTLLAGATLTPGSSPGTLTVAGNTTWHGGANYVWEINDAAGASGIAYDLVSISGALTLAATAENKFTLSLVSLLANHSSGDALNFNALVDSSYTIASAAGGIFGFDANAFTIDSSQFTNVLKGGTLSLALGNSNRDLNLHFTAAAIPEPSTYALIFGGLVLGIAAYRQRRTPAC